jgi:hypothetical protein
MRSRTYLWFGLTLGLVILVVAVFALFFYQARLTVIPTPGDAELLLNGQPISAGTPQKLPPGHYELVTRATDYLSETTGLDLSIGENRTVTINLRLIPEIQRMTSDVRFVVPTASATKELLYLGKGGRQFFRLPTTTGSDGQFKAEAISAERFQNLTNVAWSPDRTLAILQTSDGRTMLFDFKRYDFLSQEERDLGSNLRSLAWHPSEKTIIAFESTPAGERSLVRADILSGKTERLIDLRAYQLTDPILSWSPNGRKLLLIENGIYLYDITTRSVTKLAKSDGAKAASWNPASEQIVVEFADNLAIIKLSDQSLIELAFRVPLAKTTWLSDGNGLLIASPSDQNHDTFTLYSLANQTKTTYRYRTSSPVLVQALFTSNDGSQAWFVSNDTLWGLLLELEG